MIPLWQIALLSPNARELSFSYSDDIQIYIQARRETFWMVSVKVHVPGYFSWGYNNLENTAESFTQIVYQTLTTLLTQMYARDVPGTPKIIDLIKTIWK